ncbi:hypothetical protein QTP81_16965 [Alteromonas sp. ASW11-36]|uniref:TIGR04086 family membrane protein n=1 Tax=Alteromonas arenosi TaxID=3055817 RepID=A0ABT7T1H8_9ALTE|nr:hypothetical protein [Alteromonas sp. ASW11-36]MDM7862301.1 hypothetical protein [Alteromonas sp. ASW11-36]
MLMKTIRIVLTAIFCVFAAIGLGSVLMGRISPFSLVIVLLYLSVAAALNNKGGKPARVVAFFVSILLATCGLFSLAMYVSTFFGQAYDSVTPVALAVIGTTGILTFWTLKKGNIK